MRFSVWLSPVISGSKMAHQWRTEGRYAFRSSVQHRCESAVHGSADRAAIAATEALARIDVFLDLSNVKMKLQDADRAWASAATRWS
jgi:hypothetical protein